MSRKRVVPLDHAIGMGLRAWRKEFGETQAGLAHAAQILDLDWNRATVAAIEAGRRRFTLGEAAHLCYVLAWMHQQPTFLADLIPSGLTIELSPSFRIRSDVLREFLRGAPFDGQPGWGNAPAWRRGADYGLVDAPDDEDTLSIDREAERKIARKLGVPYESLVDAAKELWGHGLSVERDRRLNDRIDNSVAKRTRQALRGHITRELIAEIRGILA